MNKTASEIINQVRRFVLACKLNDNEWRFSSSPGGPETLYASAFACMLYHYIGELPSISTAEKKAWGDYLNSWQDPETGYYVGPEIIPDELKSKKHDYEHIVQHLTVHVLPALDLLGVKPNHPLSFANQYTDPKSLLAWLEARDWHDAWLEGNNLLFIGQFLITLRDLEGRSDQELALETYFNFLDDQVDPKTGLWGSNGFCSNAEALYGGYHQLLVYYYEKKPVRSPERLIDVALSLQHEDGGFHPKGGGGACEDTDAVDILVNMYKNTHYRQADIRLALRKNLEHILARQMADGGFVYRLNKPFVHMGITRTSSPSNQSNLFSTWFRIHTLALMSEILTDEPRLDWPWEFNNTCSMGWHPKWDKNLHHVKWQHRMEERLLALTYVLKPKAFAGARKIRRALGKVKRLVTP